MEPLRLKHRQPVTDDIENWDDDMDLVIDGDDLNFRGGPPSTTLAPRRRDSASSHISLRSDLESWNGEEKHVHIPGDDEESTLDAITAAEKAGIPLPKNVPSSALMGGTIRRLGGRKIRRIIHEDWENDLELPDSSQSLTIKPQSHIEFPDTLRQVSGSSTNSSPTKIRRLQPAFTEDDRRDSGQSGISLLSVSAKLDKFAEGDEDADFFDNAPDTIKLAKPKQQTTLAKFTEGPEDDDFFDNAPDTIKLSKVRQQPTSTLDKFAEGPEEDDFFDAGRDTIRASKPTQQPILDKFAEGPEDGDFFGKSTETMKLSKSTPQTTLNKFVEGPEDDDFFGKSTETLKVTKPKQQPTPNKFVEGADDDDFFGADPDTLKLPKTRQLAKPISFITPPTPQRFAKPANPDDDFENDLELPSDGKLKLSTRRDIPKTPASHHDDLDWGEGSLGTRYGGTRRDGRSARSSSASALSPSICSSITAESEDETFDGLVLPTGPVNFQERLKKRRKSRSPERIEEEPEVPAKKSPPRGTDQADFFDDLDFGDGEVFDSGKLTLHRNVKVKELRPMSPVRPKTAVSLTFTSKPMAPTQSRLPRLSHGHERAHSTSLEPVSESGGPIPQRSRRSQSRLGHSSQSSLPNLPTTQTSPKSGQAFPPSTPRRREVGTKTSLSSLRGEPTTTNAQLLKQKRSLPAIRALPSSAKSNNPRIADRPPSRTDVTRPPSVLRPKTPVDRPRGSLTDSPALYTRKPPTPFVAGGGSQRQSQTITTKGSRTFRRHDSDNSIDLRPYSRAFSRSTMRSPSPQRYRVAADTWERLSKPKNKKQFGDGHELDGFDDLPTSRETETRFMKQPNTNTNKGSLRNKTYSSILPDRMTTPSPFTPHSPVATRSTNVPHFARDTAASRIARETSLAHRTSTPAPLAPLTSFRVSQLSSRSNLTPQPHSPLTPTLRRKSKRSVQQKPHLITNLNSGKESKQVGGMYYNAETYKWEGNENVLGAFEPPITTPTTATMPSHVRENSITTPRPALITNISATKGVQVVGGMVFDPQNMCWLKLGPQSGAKSDADTMDGFDALEDEDDVFKDIPDLDETTATADDEGGKGRVSDIKDEWLVGEEFDVGPEFVRRQREEEERWRRKCEKWVSRGPRDRDAWRWTIRELVSQFDDFAM
jgi:hypothetical protein